MRTTLTVLLVIAAAAASCTSRAAVIPAANAVTPSANAVNINTATVEELEKLPYVGRRTAESIVQFRNQNGPFLRVEHILQVRGMSEARFIELRSSIRVE
ncbi:MAG: helix-hairpin-helix domain-containing protein [Pyrinomonadaceae bacterium]|nr:helix-hairpin-helix domain-containing protein [Pyrinomonadaceae bacterium]